MTAITQYSFDPLAHYDAGADFQASKAKARAERDARLREMRKEGVNAKGWTLTGQLRKWKSFGNECGMVRPVYYITVYPTAQ